jgi:hypothetical protein
VKNTHSYLIGCICMLLVAMAQTVNAQSPHKKPVAGLRTAIAPANYIAHGIAKRGPGDHGIFFDTVENKMKPTDALNSSGRQYQDIKVTLDAGDVIKTSLASESIYPMTLMLLNDVNSHLVPVKSIIDTDYSSRYNLFYKAPVAGIYTLRISCKKRAPKGKDERNYYYESYAGYTVDCVVSTVTSGVIMESPTVCDQLQFLLRQRLTNYMQITGALSDTTMDVLDKKKIQSVNHLSTFTFYKNSAAKINIDPGFGYLAFDQSLFYNSDADAAQAQRYFIEQFKACLGTGWAEEVEPGDSNWHKFTKEGNNPVSLILYPGYKYLQILM